jgi:bifunctional non-homologous end joining protein LigD
VSRPRAKVSPAPLQDFVEPMKAQLVGSTQPGDWIYEIKFDGYRALVLRGGSETRVLSRNQKDLGKKFTNIRDSIAALDVHDAIIDGESSRWMTGVDRAFSCCKASTRAWRGRQLFSTHSICCGSTDAISEARLSKSARRSWPLCCNDRPRISGNSASFTQNIDELLNRVRELSLEGLIGKRVGSKYDSKRSGAWIKIKLYQQGSFVVIPNPPASGRHMGALLVGVNENGRLKFAGRVGTGFSEKLLKALSLELNKIAVKSCPFFNLPAIGRGLDPELTVAEMRRCIWVKPAMVCEVKFTEWTRDDRLRQPVFLGLREDKNASEVIREKAS